MVRISKLNPDHTVIDEGMMTGEGSKQGIRNRKLLSAKHHRCSQLLTF